MKLFIAVFSIFVFDKTDRVVETAYNIRTHLYQQYKQTASLQFRVTNFDYSEPSLKVFESQSSLQKFKYKISIRGEFQLFQFFGKPIKVSRMQVFCSGDVLFTYNLQQDINLNHKIRCQVEHHSPFALALLRFFTHRIQDEIYDFVDDQVQRDVHRQYCLKDTVAFPVAYGTSLMFTNYPSIRLSKELHRLAMDPSVPTFYMVCGDERLDTEKFENFSDLIDLVLDGVECIAFY